MHREKIAEDKQADLEKRMKGLRGNRCIGVIICCDSVAHVHLAGEKKGDTEEGLKKRLAALKGPPAKVSVIVN